MSSVQKVINLLDYRKEAVVTTPFLEKKSLKNDFDKGTEELEDTKEGVVTIHMKDLDKFEGHFKGSTGWFNIDIEFYFFLQLIQNSIKPF